MRKMRWRIASSSESCTMRSVKSSSTVRPISSVHCSITFSNSMSRLRGGSTPMNRSPSRPMKITMSAARIFGMLKSRSARNSTSDSSWPSSARRSEPATTSTDLIARRPQS